MTRGLKTLRKTALRKIHVHIVDGKIEIVYN